MLYNIKNQIMEIYMTTSRLGVREITRNFNILENYDYVEIEDKKTHTLKGLFVSAELLDEVKSFIDMMLKARKAAELDEMMQIVGKGKISEKFNDLSLKEIKKAIAEEKNV